MSIAEQKSQAGQPTETYRMEVETVEDLEKAEAYVQQNPGTRIILDYQSSFVNRGWGEADTLDEESPRVHIRGLGGATSYEDRNSMEVIQSGGCFEGFQDWMASQAREVVDELYIDSKDIFVDEEKDREDRKIIGFGARMDTVESPNIYGATWRENPLQDETREMIEKDHVPVLPEEVEAYSFNVEEETGQKLSEQIISDGEVDEILTEIERSNPENRSGRRPTSCTVDWRPEDEYEVATAKLDTAVWPWHTS